MIIHGLLDKSITMAKKSPSTPRNHHRIHHRNPAFWWLDPTPLGKTVATPLLRNRTGRLQGLRHHRSHEVTEARVPGVGDHGVGPLASALH